MFNPFAVKVDKLLMIIGIVTFFIGSYISWRFQMIYDGILDVHSAPLISYIEAFTSNAVNVIILCMSLLIAGKIINPKTRMIDVLNTAFLSRIPIYAVAALSSLPVIKEFEHKILNNLSDVQNLQLSTNDIMVSLVFGLVSMVLLVYAIVLIVNGFKTACNAKKWQHYAGLAVALIIAEIISKQIIYAL